MAAGQQRRGQQPAFQAGGLRRDQPLLAQAQGAGLGAAALHGVPDRADQDLPVDLALHQVVLRPGGDGGDPEVLVVQAGEHAHRGPGVGPQDRVQALQPVGAGQVEVEQDALRTGQQVTRDDLGERGRHRQPQLGLHLGEQLTHQEGVAGIVLDEEDGTSGHRHLSRPPLPAPR
jgi:hypothetical protein